MNYLKLGLLAFIFSIPFTSFAQFVQKPLPYAFNALEPYIDATTMEIHYTKHHAGYVKNLNAALANIPNDGKDQKITDILKNISKYDGAVRNNAGGHYNHEFFWSILSPKSNKPSDYLMSAINKQFGSLDSLKGLLNKAAMGRFGSGWAWVIVNPQLKLEVISTPLQDNPLMGDAPKKGTPILGIDVWEHAYYLKYQNKRGDYLSAIWNVINWDEISRLYEANVPKLTLDQKWSSLANYSASLDKIKELSSKDPKQMIFHTSKLTDAAKELTKSPIPADYASNAMTKNIGDLGNLTTNLDQLIRKKAKSKLINNAITQINDLVKNILSTVNN